MTLRANSLAAANALCLGFIGVAFGSRRQAASTGERVFRIGMEDGAGTDSKTSSAGWDRRLCPSG